MAITYTWKNTVTVPGLAALPADPALLITGDYGVEIEKDVPAGATNVEVDIGSVDKTKIACVVINADKAAMDVYTNAADGTGGQHFALSANKSVAWHDQMTYANPITVNVTKVFANNSAIVAGVIRIGFLLNA